MVGRAVSDRPGLDARVAVTRPEGFSVDVSMSIAPGRTAALLGPNGSGKSTLVAAIAGLLPLADGRIALGGVTLDDPAAALFVQPEDRRVGVVFQDYVLFPHLAVVENVAFGLRSRGVDRTVARERAMNWLDRLGIAELAERRPADLSGGQGQRVALARALVTDPRLLLLDEPLSALDATTRVRLRRLLSDHLGGFAGPRLLITHDPTEAFLLADEIHVIEGGRITQVGTADDIRLRPRTQYVADLAGANLYEGVAERGTVVVGEHRLLVADTAVSGPVLATIHPRAVSIHTNRPEGSPRNAWQTTVVRVEHYGDRVRLQAGAPLALTAEITPGAEQALGLAEGSSIWVSVKATEVTVEER